MMTDTPEIDAMTKYTRAKLLNFMHGDEFSTSFLLKIMQVLHVWDDLIDGDIIPTDEEINRVFWLSLIELPLDPFYTQHFAALHPLVVNSIMNWQAANKLESTNNRADKEISYILRSSYIDILVMCALIVGGKKWADNVAVEARRWEHTEGFDEYLELLRKEVKR